MVTKNKKIAKKVVKKVSKKVEEESEEDSEGMSLDDAFGDDEDVSYAESKPKPVKKKKKEDLEEEIEEAEDDVAEIQSSPDLDEKPTIKASKPISKLVKGNKVKVNGTQMEVDAQTILIDHGTTKEMALEVFDPKIDRDYQVRYFSDQVETTLELYELQEIMYIRKPLKSIEW